MSAYLKRGIAVWIPGFLTFLAGLNTFNAVMLWTLKEGVDYLFEPYLISDIIGKIWISTYFWASATLTFVFLGFTSIAAHRKPPLDPALIKMFVKLDGNLTANRKTLRDSLENNRKTLETTRMDLLDILEGNRKAGEKLFHTVDANLGDARKEILGMLEKQGRAIQKVARLSKRGAAMIEKQRAELTDMRTRMEMMERELTPPKPRLTSLNKPVEVRGIGPRLGDELRVIGITSVGELIIADPATIAEKTRASQEMVKRLQATAQLLMVPGVDENDAELLKEAGVTTIKELAEQDPIKLSSKIGEIAKTYVEQGKISESEKPTIEEILSWVKLVK